MVTAGGGRSERVMARLWCPRIASAIYSVVSYLRILRGQSGEEALASWCVARTTSAVPGSTELDPSEVGIIGVGRGGRDDAIDAEERA